MLFLYTPLPPVPSGTAIYAARLLRDLARLGMRRDAVMVVTEEVRADGDGAAFPTVPIAGLPRLARRGETHVFFLANTASHAYIHAALRDLRRGEGARVIAVTHEPACWMLFNLAASRGMAGYARADLTEGLRGQYGAIAARLAEDFAAGALPRIFEYVTHMLTTALERCDEVWTHSRFAALKLMLEVELSAAALPRFRVLAHPAPEPDEVGRRVRGSHFTVGVFGHVTPPKRVRQAIEAFYRACCRVDPAALHELEMIVVGEISSPNSYDPRITAEMLGLGARVRFLGRVDDAAFLRLMATCDLVVNLRHPSNGETSGTLLEAEALGVPAVTTDCQALREQRAAALAPPPPGDEVEAVAAAILAAFARRRAGGDDAMRSKRPPDPPLAAALAAAARNDGENDGCFD